MEKVLEYLAAQDINVSGAQVLPSFLDPKNEIVGKNIDWTKLAKQTETEQDIKDTTAESMSLASMAAVVMLDLRAKMNLLDTCAAPGMKSLFAKYLEPSASITTNDLSFDRLKRLERLFAKHDKRANVSKQDARFLHKIFQPESFDRILIDAPCSGEGLILAGDKKQLEAWSSAKVKRLQQLQIKILKSAWQLLHPNGQLIYSTCTLNRNENERVIHKALGIDVEVIEQPLELRALPDLRDGQAWRITPSQNSIGFFIAKLSKTEIS